MVISAQELGNRPVSSKIVGTNCFLLVASIVCLLFILGCGGGDQSSSADSGNDDGPSEIELPTSDEPIPMTANELRKKLKANQYAQFQQKDGEFVQISLEKSGARDLSVLKGMPLQFLNAATLKIDDISFAEGMPLETLYLSETQVADLSPLKGMKVNVLYLDSTPVEDISALQDAEVQQLNLSSTKVTDLSPLQKVPLQILWIQKTELSDLSPMKGHPLESLDVGYTKVSDLSPLAENSKLRRLNIAGTEVTDLTPLSKLQLTRLIFNPEKIKKGLEIIREMPSIQELGTTFDGRTSAGQFWAQYDFEQAAKGESPKEEKEKSTEGQTSADEKTEETPKDE